MRIEKKGCLSAAKTVEKSGNPDVQQTTSSLSPDARLHQTNRHRKVKFFMIMNQVVKFRPFPATKVFSNGLLDELFNRNVSHFIGSDGVATQPAVNILENQDAFKVEVVAPGFEKTDFELKVEKNVLTVLAKREQKTEENVEQYTRREFRYESFQRSFNLPETVNQETVAAVYDKGILTVTLPKKEEAKPVVKSIEIG